MAHMGNVKFSSSFNVVKVQDGIKSREGERPEGWQHMCSTKNLL
jgi:hypothetical protein